MREQVIHLPRLMDRNLKETGRLHPSKVSFTLSLQPLSTADMELPEDDPAVEPGMFVELCTHAGSAGIFRVANVSAVYGQKTRRSVHLEHGIVTLASSLLFGYHELGGGKAGEAGTMYTGNVMDVLLGKQDPAQAFWVRDPALPTPPYAFSYAFENENILSALLSLTGPMEEAYMWHFDMTSFPWKMGLVAADAVPSCECRLSRNLLEASLRLDMEDLVTRVYPLGYGEGVDQLTVRDAKVDGAPYGQVYLQDDAAAAAYGVHMAVYTESTVDDPDTLYAMARRVLKARSRPRVSLTLTALDLSDLTGEPLDSLKLGRVCRVAVPDRGAVLEERIVKAHYPDVYNRPRDVRLTLSSVPEDAEDLIALLNRKTSISELCSQGAASEYGIHFGDNCDASYPASLKFFIDEDAIHVNRVICRFQVLPFRGYTKAASGGGTGNLNMTGMSVTVAVPEMDLTTGYNAAAALEGRHTHALQTPSQNLTVAFTAADLAGAIQAGSHTHPMDFGIYPAGEPGTCQVAVDGTLVPAEAISSGEFDAVPYLSRDAAGRITRNTWHEITFTPGGICRIEADLHVRTFIRSLKGAVL